MFVIGQLRHISITICDKYHFLDSYYTFVEYYILIAINILIMTELKI